jgi:MASE9 protein
MQRFSLITKIFIAGVVMISAAALVNGLLHWQTSRPIELGALLIMTLVASRLRVKLPGITGTMSVNVPYLLIAAARLNAGEALLIAALAGLMQSLAALKSPATFVQALFSSAAITNSTAAATLAFNLSFAHGFPIPLGITAAGAVFFFANTAQIAMVLWLAEGKDLLQAWLGMARLSVPCYVLSTGVAAVVCTAVQFALWGEVLAVLPLMYSIYSSYRLYFAAPAALQEPAAAKTMRAHAATVTSATVK